MKMRSKNLALVMALSALVALSAAGAMVGCKSAPPSAQNTTTPAQNTTTPTTAGTTNPDGSVTNPDGSVTYPAGSRQAQTAESEKNRPARAEGPRSTDARPEGAAPRAPVSTAKTIPSGTRVAVSMGETLSASKNNAGDAFSGVLAQPLTTADGVTVFPRGTQVEGTVTAAKGRGRFKGAGDLAIELTSIKGMRASTEIYEKTQAGKGKRTAGMIGGGAGLGAIIGGLAGGGKGAVIGGLAGAGAGTAASAYTGNKDVVIPAESVVTFHLTAPITVR
jgi:hypothetical protein